MPIYHVYYVKLPYNQVFHRRIRPPLVSQVQRCNVSLQMVTCKPASPFMATEFCKEKVPGRQKCNLSNFFSLDFLQLEFFSLFLLHFHLIFLYISFLYSSAYDYSSFIDFLSFFISVPSVFSFWLYEPSGY